MLDSSRYTDERLSNSITSSEKLEFPIDQTEPLTFKEWLKYNNTLFTNANDFLTRYQSYLNNWYTSKNVSTSSSEDIIKQMYVSLINEIVLTYTSSDEKRWLQNIDFTNSKDLAVAIPFFAQKIKEICLYYSTLRDDVGTSQLRYSLKGSNYGIEKLVYNEISKSLETEDLTDFIRTLSLSLSNIRNNLVIEIEDLYDLYPSYLDVSYNKPASTYNATGIRSEYFDYNKYNIDPLIQIDLNQSIVAAITSYPFFLLELGDNNFSITPQVSPSDLNLLKDSDFINTVNNDQASNLNINIEQLQLKKFIGTDFYYLSTGSTKTSIASGVLAIANNPFANYLNKRYPAVAAIPELSYTKTAKQLGLFFKPDKLGISNFNCFGIDTAVDYSSLSANTLYVFPDPSKFGNVSGLSQEEFKYPLLILEKNYLNKVDFSNQYMFGESDTSPYQQIYRAYEGREQTLQYTNQGQSRFVDAQDFFKGDIRSIWANEDVFPIVPKNYFPIGERLEKLFSLNKTLVTFKTDIYGNNYSLYKSIHPSKKLSNTFNPGGDGGIKYCKILDGYTFYDNVSGYNFDWTEVDPDKNYSGVILKTTTNIPPGTGYFTRADTLTGVNPLSAQYYNMGIPLFALSGTITPIISYRFQPETFCSDTLETIYICNTYDSVELFGKGGVVLPDVSSDLPSYNAQTDDLYYNALIECGASPTGPGYRPNFENLPFFTFTPYFTAVKSVEGGRFLVRGVQPCGDIVASRNVTYSEKNNFLNYKLPNRDTRVIEGISGSSYKKSIYEVKYKEFGDCYFRDINSLQILPLSQALSGLFLTYTTDILSELEYKLINIDVFYDTIQLETENYLVFDKLKFDYNTNIIENVTKSNAFFYRGNNKKFEHFSTVWFDEQLNNLYFCKTVLYPELSATNKKIIYPEIYSINNNSLVVNKLYPLIPDNALNIDYLIQFSLSGKNIELNIVETEKPIFNYDYQTENFVITYLGKDMANVFYIFKTYFKFVNGTITNVNNFMYKLSPDVYSNNFESVLLGQYSTFNIIGSSGVVNGVYNFNE